jgi:cytochrome c oxidase subunit 2
MVTGTNANTMIVPGYISQFTTVFDAPGDYLVTCHEFCGNGHHAMYGRIIVERAAPVVSTSAPTHQGAH